MASSGTITNAIRTGYAIQIAWTVNSQSVADNTSSVTAKVQLVSTGSSYTINSSASKSGSLTINGTKYSFTFTAALSGNQTKTIYTKTVTVKHNTNGTKSCAFSCVAGIDVTLSGTFYGDVTASGTGTFNTIARASSISSVTSSVAVNGTNAVTVAISRAASSFTHTVVFKFGSYSKTTEDVGTSTSYTIPVSWINAMPNATSGTATVTVTTYSGSTKIGTAVSKTFKLTVPASVVPSVSNLALSEAVSGINAQFKGYVQNKSKLAVKITASGVYSSTIKSYKTVILGKTYTAASFTSGTLTSSGSVAVAVTVTDSRGRTATKTTNVTVIAYTPPKITTFSGLRALADGTENYDGTFLKVKMNFAIAAVNNLNTKSYTIEYKLQDSDTWTVLTSGSVYALNDSLISESGFLIAENSYEIRLSISDFFGTVQKMIEIPTAFTLLDFNKSGHGMAFGKVSEVEDEVEFNMDVNFYKNIQMGGWKWSNDEKNMYFSTREDATNVHNCKFYGGNGESVTSIGCWDTLRSHGIWRYLSGTQNLVFDANVKVTRANGGDEFITSEPVTHGSRTGKVHFSNGLLLQWGVETITPVANTPTAKAVKFSTAYTSVPMVITTAHTTVMGTSVTGCAAADITTTGFDAYITRSNATNTSVGWVAIGYKA